MKSKDGKKMYPIASWQRNQHKLYNAYDRAVVSGNYEEAERIDKAIAIFDFNPQVNGVVYAVWSDVVLVKDYIAGYDARH